MIVTRSRTMMDLIERARRAAGFPVPVLLCGETGTGKELLADLLHQSSPRRSHRFVKVNCAALSDNLIASELFGHQRGAFTDAVTDRVGRFEQAERGTILLDEIGEIPLAFQAKLLRVIENREFERVGSSQTITHDVRILAATNRDLKQLVETGDFRLDLLHRLNVVQLFVPPLRERLEDVPLLTHHFVEQFCREVQCESRSIDDSAIALLLDYDWPGNVRELRNVIQRACILSADCQRIAQQHICLYDDSLQQTYSRPYSSTRNTTESSGMPDDWTSKGLAEIERDVILANIKKHGSQRNAAEHLGVSTRTLTNKMRKYRESDSRKAA